MRYMKNRKNRKAFTLIELLVVIAIIAVLSVVVILSLNPAELLRQSRDSNRISNMATLKSAISLYLADVASPNLASTSAAYGTGYYSSNLGATTTFTVALSGIGSLGTNGPATSTGLTSQRAVNSTGWIPVNFSAISSGAPLGNLPVDPVNVASSGDPFGDSLVYGYVATSTNISFKVTAHMESSKYKASGPSDVETSDGGLSTNTYEQGTNLAL